MEFLLVNGKFNFTFLHSSKQSSDHKLYLSTEQIRSRFLTQTNKSSKEKKKVNEIIDYLSFVLFYSFYLSVMSSLQIVCLRCALVNKMSAFAHP
jgi:hypothetical protein